MHLATTIEHEPSWLDRWRGDVSPEPVPEALVPPWERSIGLLLDGVALVLSAAVALTLLFSAEPPGQRWIALGFFLFVPGWVVLRRVGAPPSALALCSAIGLSIATTMIGGEILVATGWLWRTPVVVAATLAAVGAALSLAQPAAAARTTSIEARGLDPDAPATSSLPPWIRLAPLVVGAVLAGLGVNGVDLGAVDGYGLLPAMPPIYFVGVAILAIGLYWTLAAPPARLAPIAVLYVLALLLVLHGLPGFIESNPRFPVAWLHAGFSDHIASTGELLTNRDARFSWAGFFTGSALIDRVGGEPAALWLVPFAPVVLSGLTAWAVFHLGRAVRLPDRQVWAAVGVFMLVNWVGQDYYSPQGVAFFLCTLVIAIVLGVFPGSGLTAGSWLHGLIRPSQPDSGPPLSPRARNAVYYGLLVLIGAITMSHQLTPVLLTLLLLSLTVTRSTRLLTTWIIVGVAAVVWLAFGAEAFWLGHLERITGSAGEPGKVLQTGVGARASGAAAARQVVVKARIGLAVAVWAAAGLGLVVAWMRRKVPVALACLLLVPFGMALLQAYGGEIVLRILLYTLPAATLLIGTVALPRRNTILQTIPRVLVLAAVAPVFLLARFGNEGFERVTDDDRNLIDHLYAELPDGAVVFIANTQVPQYSQRTESVRWFNMATLQSGEMERVATGFATIDRSFILLTEGQDAYARQVQDAPEDWLERTVDDLVATGRFRIMTREGDSVLLERTS